MQCNVYRLMFFVTKTVFAERLSLSKVFELYRAGGATWWGYDTGSNPALCFLFFIVTDIQLCSPCQLRCAPACGFDHFWLRWNLATWRWHQNILYLDVHPSYNGGMKGVRITMVVPQLFGIGPTCSIGSIGLTLPNLAMQAVAVWIYIYSCSRAHKSNMEMQPRCFWHCVLTASKAQWLLNCLGFCLIHTGYIHVLAAIRRS